MKETMFMKILSQFVIFQFICLYIDKEKKNRLVKVRYLMEILYFSSLSITEMIQNIIKLSTAVNKGLIDEFQFCTDVYDRFIRPTNTI